MSKKQAVLLIHGIGEQRPMDTLRGFVDAVWTHDTSLHNPNNRYGRDSVWSKPDTVSLNYELRRLTTPKNRSEISTDFFEFYWAHLMKGTNYGHVVAWLKTILMRSPSTVPSHLRSAYALIMIVLAAAVGLAIYAGFHFNNGQRLPAWLAMLSSLVLIPAAGLVINAIIGDAARYLHVAPKNIQRRHEIRQAGVTLLHELHRRGYDRILVVGHSLGSVIGYDILTYAWPDFNDVAPGAQASKTALTDLEALANSPPPAGLLCVRSAQGAYFRELGRSGNRWRVSDFVTLGSPLAHAAILLARNADALVSKQRDRELPTCLPTLETMTRGGVEVHRFSFDETANYRKPHHAAVFGPTRWTNLYFPCKAIIHGDLIGGPIAGVLGSAIMDRPVSTTQRGGFLSHTLYWRPEHRDKSPHIDVLRAALDLADDAKVIT